MNRIHLLSPELISQISAGEVIERPASALKELVENSLDSCADSISVELEQGGMQKIRVVDNGSGMSAEDAEMAFIAHATSKVSTVEDLFHLSSLGFRGEALASIASIAHVTLKTRPADDRVGTLIEFSAGKKLTAEETACPTGTDICVTGLFHPVPARRKYMKSETTEYGHCFEILSQLAMAHPHVGFRLLKDGGLVFELPAGQNLKERIRLLYGGTSADALIPVTYHQSNLIISGFVGKPELSRSSRKYQFLFVNGHPIENRLVGHAVQEAFHSLLMTDKFPWYALDLQMDPAFVDVNVHPRKLEVKFVNTQEVYRSVFGAVQSALRKAPLGSALSGTFAGTFPSPFSRSLASSSPSVMPLEMDFQTGGPEQEKIFVQKPLGLRPLVQVANRYIVAESVEGLVLIDQHAGHERVRYERLMQAMNAFLEQGKDVPKQVLLTPLQLDLGVDSVRLLKDYQTDFEALGYEFENFGGSTYLVRAVPLGMERRDPERVIQEVLADVTREWKQNHVKNVREILLTTTACRGAIKFGDPLSMPEMQSLLNDMAQTPNYDHCPHGRPSILTWSHEKLEELFKRRNF